jgi:hypothetical protein
MDCKKNESEALSSEGAASISESADRRGALRRVNFCSRSLANDSQASTTVELKHNDCDNI